MQIADFGFYTAFHNNVPNDGIAAYVVVEKNV
jgi:hypothetical protein